ncbi:DUF4244 domain-containing protein [Actinomadura alba]|nr:DUF4244 domain-containing protein [Actinomadura alba]
MRMAQVMTRSRGRHARDDGMSTAEYAVGTVAAAAFAGLLFKIVTSPEVRRLLLDIVKRALQLAG